MAIKASIFGDRLEMDTSCFHTSEMQINSDFMTVFMTSISQRLLMNYIISSSIKYGFKLVLRRQRGVSVCGLHDEEMAPLKGLYHCFCMMFPI